MCTLLLLLPRFASIVFAFVYDSVFVCACWFIWFVVCFSCYYYTYSCAYSLSAYAVYLFCCYCKYPCDASHYNYSYVARYSYSSYYSCSQYVYDCGSHLSFVFVIDVLFVLLLFVCRFLLFWTILLLSVALMLSLCWLWWQLVLPIIIMIIIIKAAHSYSSSRASASFFSFLLFASVWLAFLLWFELLIHICIVIIVATIHMFTNMQGPSYYYDCYHVYSRSSDSYKYDSPCDDYDYSHRYYYCYSCDSYYLGLFIARSYH